MIKVTTEVGPVRKRGGHYYSTDIEGIFPWWNLKASVRRVSPLTIFAASSEGGHSDRHGGRHEGRYRARPPDAIHL